MKSFIKHIILIVALILTTVTCEDGGQTPQIPDGIYQGVFVQLGLELEAPEIDTVRIEFQGNDFRITGQNALNYGYGTWEADHYIIQFNDEIKRNSMHNWQWLLNGTYRFELSKSSLYLIKEEIPFQYKYHLTKK